MSSAEPAAGAARNLPATMCPTTIGPFPNPKPGPDHPQRTLYGGCAPQLTVHPSACASCAVFHLHQLGSLPPAATFSTEPHSPPLSHPANSHTPGHARARAHHHS